MKEQDKVNAVTAVSSIVLMLCGMIIGAGLSYFFASLKQIVKYKYCTGYTVVDAGHVQLCTGEIVPYVHSNRIIRPSYKK